MIKTDKILGLMAENHITQKELSETLGITAKTFRDKMGRGVFGSDEIQKMIDVLHIEDPVSIFFAEG